MGMYSRRHNRRQIVYIYLVNSLEWKKITGCKETLLETLYITPFTFCLHNLYILCLLQSWLIIHILASWSVERILRSMSIHLRRFRWLTFRWMTVLPESLKCICNICKLTYLCIYYRLSLPVCLVICISVCLPLNMSIYPFAYLAVSVSVYPFTYNAYVQIYVVHYVDLCKLVFVYINLPWQLILIFIYKVNEWKIQKKMKEKKNAGRVLPSPPTGQRGDSATLSTFCWKYLRRKYDTRTSQRVLKGSTFSSFSQQFAPFVQECQCNSWFVCLNK